MTQISIRRSLGCYLPSHEPLYKRVPTRDETGRLLGDFMMLIPGLREWPQQRFLDRVAGIQAVLGEFEEVVFADLNVPLNVLWVSVKPRPGIITEVASSLQTRVPEARIVSSNTRP